MKELYTIENKSFKVSLNVTDTDKFKVLLKTENGGEFSMGFVTYAAAVTFFEKLTGDLYQYEH